MSGSPSHAAAGAAPTCPLDPTWLRAAAEGLGHGSRRGLDRVAPGTEAAHRAWVVAQATTPDHELLVASGPSGPVGCTTLRAKPMETELLGHATAALTDLLTHPSDDRRPGTVRALLDLALAAAGARGVELVVLRVDADDVDALAVAQDAGFRVHEATLTWLADSDAAVGPPRFDDGTTVEVHEGSVAGALPDEVVHRLAGRTAAWGLSHLRADPRLDDAAVDRFYGAWIHNIASGRWSDCLTVARHRGRIVGIQSEVTDREVREATGLDIRGGEWIVVLEPGLGAGRALMAGAGRHRHPGGRFHSWETQVRNAPTIRCIEATGVARPIRAAYTLHAWLDR